MHPRELVNPPNGTERRLDVLCLGTGRIGGPARQEILKVRRQRQYRRLLVERDTRPAWVGVDPAKCFPQQLPGFPVTTSSKQDFDDRPPE